MLSQTQRWRDHVPRALHVREWPEMNSKNKRDFIHAKRHERGRERTSQEESAEQKHLQESQQEELQQISAAGQRRQLKRNRKSMVRRQASWGGEEGLGYHVDFILGQGSSTSALLPFGRRQFL
jgi:hypothetical protein